VPFYRPLWQPLYRVLPPCVLVAAYVAADHAGMRPHRFSVADVEAHPLRLTGDQAAHARVLRLRPGDAVDVFDATGRSARGHITAVDGGEFEITVEATAAAADLAVTLHLAVAAPKGTRGDWLVEKCAELGVAELHWLQTARGTVVPRPAKLDRWRRKAVEAAKQCGRARPMTIHAPRSMADVHAACGGEAFFGDAEGPSSLIDALQGHDADSHRPIVIFVGPEGGFTAQERQSLTDHGATAVSIGPTTLRIETAAVAAAAIISAWSQPRDA